MKQIIELKDLSEKEQELVKTNKYHLLRDKTLKLKEKGTESCKGDDAFDLSDMKITDDARELINNGIQQIIDYRGLTFDRPLENLGIGGFYFFMSIFYLERRRQLGTKFEGYTMDSMLMKNSVTGDEMWLANKVDEIPDEEIEKYMKK